MDDTRHHDHDHGDDHGHDHGAHAPAAKDEKVHSYHQYLGLAMKELLIEKGVVTADEIRKAIELRDGITPALGAKMVARAWTDPAYKERLLKNGVEGAKELGSIPAPRPTSSWSRTRRRCTTWWSARSAPAIRAIFSGCRRPGTRASNTARASCASRARCCANSAPISPTTSIFRCTIRPPTSATWFCRCGPAGTEGMTPEQLAAMVTRDCMVGVAVPKAK